MMADPCGADVLVRNLKAQGVSHVFGIPGAKIDRVFNSLLGSGIETVVCRHEQNAAFIAAGIGKMTGRAGVVAVTSGPGATNLATGFATANSEGMPLIGFAGSVPRSELLKQTHQSLDSVALFKPVTRYAAEVESPEAIGEVVANAFRAAETGRRGAAYVSLPFDVMNGPAPDAVLTPVSVPHLGPAPESEIAAAARLIEAAALPVLLLGMDASRPGNAAALRTLLHGYALPTVCTYQGAGVVSRDLLHCFAGRVGLFHNQPSDHLLDAADVVIAVGYNPIEYDPYLWNKGKTRTIIHIDHILAAIDRDYRPTLELSGDIGATIAALAQHLAPRADLGGHPLLGAVHRELEDIRARGAALGGMPMHPLRIISDLQPFITEDVTLALDIGSFYIWHSRYLYSFRPEQLLISNGQQTLGVALPWAIAACIARPHDRVLSVSGDGGFLFSAQELETAVRLKCNFVHMIWTDGTYDMVAFQERMKYGHTAGVEFGPVDKVKYAEAFGATGFRITQPEEFVPILRKAMEIPGPVLIDIPVDYTHNIELGQAMHDNVTA
jgi:acetolactate synthase-1/2/3 large subunit